jgi:hypothetical protein
METVRYTLQDGEDLTFEEQEAARLRIEAASKRPYIYDPDCPLLTPKQLDEFYPVNYKTLEERAQALEEARIFSLKNEQPECMSEAVSDRR